MYILVSAYNFLLPAMKKIILHPKTDTVILCLPEEWIGTPVVCNLSPVTEKSINKDEIKKKNAGNRSINNKKIFSLQQN
jgi:hypothetical protein